MLPPQDATEKQASFHYNGGPIPLASVLFGTGLALAAARRPLVWVFVIDADAGKW
jgi:hypothetical protein